jgi:hypothetical protein
VWRKAVTLEELAIMSDEHVMMKINEFLVPGNRLGLPPKADDLVGAQFYMAELDRRNARLIEQHRQKVDAERDRIERSRHHVSLTIEILVVFLISAELVFAIIEGREQARILSGLQSSSAATASILTNLQASGTPNGLDTTKVSEMTLTVKYDATARAMVVTNLGPVDITLLAYKFGNGRGIETELGPHQAIPPGLTSAAVPIENAVKIMGNYPKSSEEYYMPFRLWFRERDGTEYLANTPLAFKPMDGSYEVSCGMTTIVRYNTKKSS